MINNAPTVAVDQEIRAIKLEGVLDAIRQIGWRVLDYGLHTRLDLGTTQLAGIIAEKDGDELNNQFIGLSETDLPIVSVGLFLPDRYKYGFVVNRDYRATANVASAHFVEKGIRQIAMLIHDPPGHYEPLCRASKAETEKHGAGFHLFRYTGSIADTVNSDPSGSFAVWLERIPKPLGIFCVSDRIGALLCRVCLELGWSVPTDIAVLGLGNERLACEASVIPLSSIDCNDMERGRVAVGIVADFHSSRKDITQNVPIPPRGVVERRSTGSEALTNQVRVFLQDNLHCGLTIEDVASEFQVSRRTIERAFKGERGKTILSELRSLQFQRCCDLLTTTDISINTIVSLVGFSSKEYLQRVFRNKYGVSLKGYREKQRGVVCGADLNGTYLRD